MSDSLDHAASPDLRARSVEGGIFALVAQALQFLIIVASTMVLARLLSPVDFGLVAMALVLVTFLDSFRDFGLPLAIIARPAVDDGVLTALFWRSLGLTAVLMALTVLVAPLLAAFFDEPKVTMIVVVFAAGLLVNGSSHVHLGILRRQLRFRLIAGSEIAATASGAIVAVAAAVAGAGYWALVLQQVAGFVVVTIVLWWGSGWMPRGVRSGAVLRRDERLTSVIAYGRDTILVRMFARLLDQMDRVLVGRVAGPAALGLYQTARRWATLPIKQTVSPIKPVAVASFSRLQNEPVRYRAYLQESLLIAYSAALPLSAFLIVDAREVVLFLVGPQWLAAVPLLQLLVLATTADLTRRLTTWIYLAESQTRRRLHWTLMSRPIVLAAALVGSAWGATGIAVAMAAANIALAHPSVTYCLAASPLSVKDFWRSAVRPALATSAAAAVLLTLHVLLARPEDFLLRLIVDLPVFSLAYTVSWLVLPGGWTRAKRLALLGGDAVMRLSGQPIGARVTPSDSASR